MRRWVIGLLTFAALAAVMTTRSLAAAGSDDSAREVLGELLRRVRASGRAEATLERVVTDPVAGGRRCVRGRLALEPPDRADVRFTPSGERIVVRADGGEWLQPELGQMLILGPERAAAARRWSQILLVDKGAGLVVRRLTPGRFLVISPAGVEGGPDSAWVSIAASGLPSRLEIREEVEQPTVYHFTGWHFSRPRGPAAFTIEPPAGYDVVRLP